MRHAHEAVCGPRGFVGRGGGGYAVNTSTPISSAPATSVEADASGVRTVPELARVLRLLHRREARNRDGARLTYRELAAKTGWSRAIIGEYLKGTALPPTDRFDHLVQILGASRSELGPLATARDRVEELRRPGRSPLAAPVAAVNGERVPRELPAPVPGFVGRQADLDELDRLATSARERAGNGGLAIAAICGGGGVGKTALAVQWAHRRAADFPDGQLYIDLRGFSSREPVEAADALGRFLHALGVEPGRVPAGVDEGAARFRTMLAGRRMLVVLDNAVSSDHVRPLLPGSASCMVVVTSRDSLAGLVAADGAQRIQLDVLPDAEGVSLLRALLADRVDAAPHDAGALVRLCGGLPLALRVAAELAASRPDASLAELVADLRDEQARLDLLAAGDDRSTVRSVLSWSYLRLSPSAARLFRLLGADPGPELSAAAAASLAGVPVMVARRLVGELIRAHMLTEVSPDRYALHDVLRAYAGDLLDTDAPQDRRPAIRRLLDHYVHTAARADRLLEPSRTRVGLVDASVGTVVCDIASAAHARAWLHGERGSLLAAARFARDYGFADHAWQLAWALVNLLDLSVCGLDWLAVNAIAPPATVDPEPGTLAHRGLTRASAHSRLFDVARERWEQAAGQYALTEDPLWEAIVAANLSEMYSDAGQPTAAVDCALRAVAIFRAHGDDAGLAVALNHAGYCRALLGDYETALAECREALELWRGRGDLSAAAPVLVSIGFIYQQLGDLDEAVRHYRQALTGHWERGDRLHEATVWTYLGEVYERAGDAGRAGEAWRSGLSILDELGHADAVAVRARIEAVGALAGIH